MPDYAERVSRGQTIPEATPPTPSSTPGTGPQGPTFNIPAPPLDPLNPLESRVTGRDRWDQLLRQRPIRYRSEEEYDAWVLGLPGDPSDPEYTQVLTTEQARARQRTEQRERQKAEEAARKAAEAAEAPQAPDPGELLDEIGREKEYRRKNPKPKAKPVVVPPVIIGPDGKPVENPGLSGGAEETEGQADAMAPTAETGAEVGDLIKSGDYVYIGTETSKSGGSYADTTQHAYMAVEDAYNLPAYWAPEQVAALQATFGVPVTGVFDEKTFAKWKDVVDTAARLTAAGRNVNLMEIVAKTAPEKKPRGGGGGGGGGGYSASEVKAFFNSVAEEELGREATPEEQAAFFAALKGAGDVDPQQFAIDWIRQNASGEAGAYSAVNYYDAMMQILGANTSAAGA